MQTQVHCWRLPYCCSCTAVLLCGCTDVQTCTAAQLSCCVALLCDVLLPTVLVCCVLQSTSCAVLDMLYRCTGLTDVVQIMVGMVTRHTSTLTTSVGPRLSFESSNFDPLADKNYGGGIYPVCTNAATNPSWCLLPACWCFLLHLPVT